MAKHYRHFAQSNLSCPQGPGRNLRWPAAWNSGRAIRRPDRRSAALGARWRPVAPDLRQPPGSPLPARMVQTRRGRSIQFTLPGGQHQGNTQCDHRKHACDNDRRLPMVAAAAAGIRPGGRRSPANRHNWCGDGNRSCHRCRRRAGWRPRTGRRGRRRHCRGPHRKLQLQRRVIRHAFLRIEQAYPSCGQLVENLLRQRRVFAGLKRADVHHLPVGGVGNHVGVRLEQANAQQAVMMGRLLLSTNTQPFSIRIEACHRAISSATAKNRECGDAGGTTRPDGGRSVWKASSNGRVQGRTRCCEHKGSRCCSCEQLYPIALSCFRMELATLPLCWMPSASKRYLMSLDDSST